MVLSKEVQREIKDFVRQKPRNIQEIADKIGKSWKTAERYVKEIAEKDDKISIRKFREGSRGSLNVIYWSGRSAIFSSGFKENLYERIENGGDFSPFDVYQCVDEELREAFVEKQDTESLKLKHDAQKLLREAEEKILVFSRNLSWAELKQDDKSFTELFREMAEEGVDISFLGRIDLSTRGNAEELLNINDEVGREAVSVKHSIHPIRGFIVDDKLVHLSEARELEEEYVNQKDDRETTYIFYSIRDCEWVEWLENCFWNLNRNALNSKKRIEDLKTIKNTTQL